MNTKIETWLPVFPGFYGTIFEPDHEMFLEDNEVNYDQIEFNNSEYEKDVATSCCDFLENELEFVTAIKLQAVSSPREYNFGNDSINVEIELTKDNLQALSAYLRENREKLAEYLKERYTSRPGFSSFYPNHVEGWAELTKEFTEFDSKPRILGSLLEFVCENESIAKIDMYYHVSGNVSADCYCSIKETA